MTVTRKTNMLSYGKGNVFAYRTYLKPLNGIQPIPESSFTGRDNIIFGLNVKVEIGGKAFLPSFTDGDNSLVIATDSMKNFIQTHLGSYSGSTAEGFLHYVAQAFLDKYPQIETVKLSGEEVPFETTLTTTANGLTESTLVFKKSRNEQAQATIEMVRTSEGSKITNHSSGISNLELIKVSGNSFIGFVRDEYTTLPEDGNRPLFIYLNITWEYENIEHFLEDTSPSYVAAEQVRDIACSVFHELETPSIQNLIYHIGCRILTRFPQLHEVTFQSQNHTWDKVVDNIPNSQGKVYTEPRPPYGFQLFSITKEDLNTETESPSSNNLYKTD